MKVAARLLVVVFVFLCACYYLGVDFKNAFDFISSGDNESKTNIADSQNKVPDTEISSEDNTAKEGNQAYDEIIEFLMNQKNGKKLIESFRVLDEEGGESLKGRSNVQDNAASVIALINNRTDITKAAAVDILKNFAVVQNSDGSWFDFYDTSGRTINISGKDYTKCDTGNNALLLYAYSYYTNFTQDTQFKDIMKKSANYIASRDGGKKDGLYDNDTSIKGIKSVRSNTYGYFALREYALSCLSSDYYEYKGKLFESDKIADFVAESCLDRGAFIKSYTGKDKSTILDLDSQILGAMLIKAANYDSSIKYDIKDMDNSLSKLYKSFYNMEGYKLDSDTKNNQYIWCEGTCRVPLALIKLDDMEKSKKVIGYVEKMISSITKSSTPRGVPLSTNVDSKINMPSYESVSSSAWAAITMQCIKDSQIELILFGREEDLFTKYRQYED